MATTTQKNLESQPGYSDSISLETFTLDARKIENYSCEKSTVIITE
jgi:hypothetical protein